MEKNKTAMQELWEYLIEDKTIPFEHYRKIRNKIHPLIQKEKQQILDAFHAGDNSDCTSEQNAYEFAEQYYKETYEK